MFEPKDDVARWRTIYDHIIKPRNIGDVVTDDELAATFPGVPTKTINSAFWDAVRRGAEIEMHRTFERVPRVGYRMIEASEHLAHAAKKQRYAMNDSRRALGQLSAADRSRLTSDEARVLGEQQDHLGRRLEAESKALRRLERTVTLMNRRVMTTEVGLRDVRREQAEVRTLLERHGVATGGQDAEVTTC